MGCKGLVTTYKDQHNHGHRGQWQVSYAKAQKLQSRERNNRRNVQVFGLCGLPLKKKKEKGQPSLVITEASASEHLAMQGVYPIEKYRGYEMI